MSTQRGNQTRKRPQKHQNTYAFTVKKKVNPLEAKILDTPTSRFLCPTCADVIAWKKQFKKYKPLSTPRRCSTCQEKNVVHAYMVHCEDCAEKNNICAKCSTQNLSEILKERQPRMANKPKRGSAPATECKCATSAKEMTPEEIFELFPEYSKEYEETGRLAERTMRTIQRRLDRREAECDSCDSHDGECHHHHHSHHDSSDDEEGEEEDDDENDEI
ncbi:putative C9orf85 like protein [Blattamonas nauphoetae]|uniref:C9orf85 like protein n=1 Tax=Blattamonas nauphoetae TaxID=2049346 RepID=A0ABQ9YKR2_9EUKA|nr:putative C9orf85 like protein [Blattamonas nauphoetae]